MASGANFHDLGNPYPYTMLQGFEWYTPGGGQQWDWLNENSKRFSNLGITAIWLPPTCKAASIDSVGYDIYDFWDLGEFCHPRDNGKQIPCERTKYGTRSQLENCMQSLRNNNITIYLDAILNHKIGADNVQSFDVVEVDPKNRTKILTKPFKIQGWTNFSFPNRAKNQYSTLHWTFEQFTGVDWDQSKKQKGIYLIKGKHWANDVDKSENSNYDYLMGADIDHSNLKARNDILNWGSWLIKTFPISGFRFDAVIHISEHFIYDFVKQVRQDARQKRKASGKPIADEKSFGPLIFGVGEFWKDSTDSMMQYLDDFGDEQFSLFDVPLHYNFKKASDSKGKYDLRNIFNDTLVQKRPADAVTFVDNHDTQHGQALESTIGPDFKPLAYALILLRKDGYPCVFLGDLDGCHGGDGNKTTEGKEIVFPPVVDLDKLIKSRKCFGFGEQHDYFDQPKTIGWIRDGERSTGKTGCAVVINISDKDEEKRMQVQAKQGDIFVDALNWFDEEIVIQKDGWANFKTHNMSVSIWIPKSAKNECDL